MLFSNFESLIAGLLLQNVAAQICASFSSTVFVKYNYCFYQLPLNFRYFEFYRVRCILNILPVHVHISCMYHSSTFYWRRYATEHQCRALRLTICSKQQCSFPEPFNFWLDAERSINHSLNPSRPKAEEAAPTDVALRDFINDNSRRDVSCTK